MAILETVLKVEDSLVMRKANGLPPPNILDILPSRITIELLPVNHWAKV